jgi:hypothetical protein
MLVGIVLGSFGCAKTTRSTSLGRIHEVELYYRQRPPNKPVADVYYYRIICDTKVVVCWYASSSSTPEKETSRFNDMIRRWRASVPSSGTTPVVIIDDTVFEHTDGSVYGDQGLMVFCPDERNVADPRAPDFSWDRYPSTGFVSVVDLPSQPTDRLLASSAIGSNAYFNVTEQRSTKSVATGP